VGVSVARYYDPTTAQFLTRDPLESVTGSPYGYVDGDPLDGSDPSGLFCLLGHSGRGCRGGGTYNWSVTHLDPVSYVLPFYAKEYDSYNRGCGLWTSLKYGAEGTAMAALMALGPEEGPVADAVAAAVARAAEWLGPEARMILNDAGDRIFVSKDGLRQIRVDRNRTFPHSSPHAHVEEKVNGEWQRSGPLYPKDVPQR
jgi:hypothetical protein